MDDIRLDKYYRPTGFGWRSLVYHYLMTDRHFRTLLNFGPYCTALTTITFLLVTIIFAYTLTDAQRAASVMWDCISHKRAKEKSKSWAVFLMNAKKYNALRHETERKLPRKESVLQVKPAYNCINKHLQQTGIFLDKAKTVVRKEQLEVELMNSRINSITELLNPGDQSPWRQSMTPKRHA